MRTSPIAVLMLCAGQLAAQFTTVHTGPVGSSLEAIAFPTPTTGYAVGKDGAAFKSTDGGLSWIALSTSSGAYLFGVSFLDDLNGFASGGGAEMLRTLDGGSNWTAQSVPFTECIYQVRPINDTLVYAGGWGGYFFRTVDGGGTWTVSSVDVNNQGWIFAMRFLNADTGWTAGADGDIYRTIDGGLNWIPCTSGTTNQLRGISFPDATTGYAVGFFGTVRKSVDGGATWSTINTGYPGDSYYAVHFTDADHGVICGGFYAGSWQGVVMRTDDGGLNWSRVHTGGPVLNGITVNDGNTFAVGVDQVIIAELSATGIPYVPGTVAIMVHPDPASTMLRIVPGTAFAGTCRLQVFGADGRCVLEHDMELPADLNVAALAPGAYVLAIQHASSRSTVRFRKH